MNISAKTGTPKEKQPVKKGSIFDKINIVQIPLTAAEFPYSGNVKTVRYRDYEMVGKAGKIEKNLVDSGFNAYDIHGHLIDQNEYTADGKPKWKCTYTYDDHDRATEWHFIFYQDNNESITTFVYDDNGNQIESLRKNELGKITTRTLTTYDKNGNKLDVTVYDSTGRCTAISSSKYDENNNQVELLHKTPEGQPRFKQTAVYDDAGFKLSGKQYFEEALQGSWTRKNNKLGQVLEMQYFTKDGALEGKMTYTYDKMYNPITYASYNADGSIDQKWSSATTYEYDKTGNITKQTEYKTVSGKQIPTTCYEAEYTYH